MLRKARVGGYIRHHKTATFGARERPQTVDDWGLEIDLLVEPIVLHNSNTKVGFGEVGVGGGGENAGGDV